MRDAFFNRLVLWFGLGGWACWTFSLVVAPATWWTVLILSFSILTLAIPPAMPRDAPPPVERDGHVDRDD